jgi:dephospho-CoA kinase
VKLIGLTGGIASGKSLVTSELRRLGAQVLDADEIYHELLESSAELQDNLRREFGPGIFGADGRVDRKKLGAAVFGNKDKLAALNSITHPMVIDEMWDRVDECMIEGLGDGMVFLSVPLLFEARMDEMVDETLVIYAPPEVQKERLMNRDKIGEEDAQKRLDAQWPIERKRDRAGFVIDNAGSVEATVAQVKATLERLKNGERGKGDQPHAPPAAGPHPLPFHEAEPPRRMKNKP